MRKILLSSFAALAAFSASAQTVANFDTLQLTQADTFYLNYSAFGTDVGFDDGLAYFPCVYDTSFGFPYWREGFAYSNMTDDTTQGYTNQYSAITGKGYNNSSNYVVAYNAFNKIFLKDSTAGKPVEGFYVTNDAYTYFSMKNGDAFAKKFGGADGTDPDWFKLLIKGFSGGQLTADSVEFFLADFRSSDNTQDTIINKWTWVNLLPLGNVDSLQMELSSSDVGAFGMNTPAYFCMDNFTTHEVVLGVNNLSNPVAAKVYPNPVIDQLFVETNGSLVQSVQIYDVSGKLVAEHKISEPKTAISTSTLTPGVYMLTLSNGSTKAIVRFVKQ